MFNQKHHYEFIRTEIKRATTKSGAFIQASSSKESLKPFVNPNKTIMQNHRLAAEMLAEKIGLCQDGSVLVSAGWIGNKSLNYMFVPVHPSDAARIVGQKRKKKVDAAA